MDAVGYARISLEDQSRNSLPGQVDRITQYCQRNKLNLHKVFIENGQSAFNFARKEWKDLEKHLQQHKEVKYLIIDTMDRFSRANLLDALQKMHDIQQRTKVTILTVADPVNLDINDFGTDLRRIMELMFSNYELKRIRKRTSDGMYQSTSSGRWVNKAPYGYINSRDEQGKPILTIDEEKAHIVRLVFRQFISGMQLEEIRKSAGANGMKLKSSSAVRRILENPLYASLINLPKHGHNPAKMVKAIHPPIISENDYWLVQERINTKTRATQRHENVYLKGALHCECGLKFSSDKSKGKSGKYYNYYLCRVHRKNFSAVKLHKQMDEILQVISLPKESIALVGEKLKKLIDEKVSNKGGDMMRTKLNLKKVQDKIADAEEKYLKQPGISEKSYQKVMSEYRADEQRLFGQIAELSSTKDGYYSIMDELLPKLSNLKEIFAMLPLLRKTAFIKVVFGDFLTYKDGVFRTHYLHPLFAGNVLVLKEKGLLYVEQSFSNGSVTPGRSPYGSWLEHLKELWEVMAA